MSLAVRSAYDGAAAAWDQGPDLVFSALASALLDKGPSWQDLTVVDVGAGSGTATRQLVKAGARVVPVDTSVAMLAMARRGTPCSPAGGDALALPVRTASVDAAVLGFVLNHLRVPEEALREAARVVRPGGWVLASTWSATHSHPVREVVQDALAARGWRAPTWYEDLKTATTPLTDAPDALAAAATTAGLKVVQACVAAVPVAATAQQLVAWRLGLPQVAPFVEGLTEHERTELLQEVAQAALPPLVCSVVLLTARVRPAAPRRAP